MRIAVVGSGYVGLVTGTCFAEMGNDVVCVDVDGAKVERLQRGVLPIFEPGLELYFERSLREGRLAFTTELAPAVAASEVVFLALPTPSDGDGGADLTAVLQVAGELGLALDGYTVVVNKSTAPVGTTERIRDAITATGKRPGDDFDVVSNPEFLREGVAVEDFMKPERVVVGSSSERATRLMRDLYEPFVRSGNPILVMDERSAEVTKYAANAFLATKITFMNEIARLCEAACADVDQVRIGIGTDSRIGKQFLYAGIGFGGSCFPKDTRALVRTAREHGVEPRIVEAVLAVNEEQRRLLGERIVERFGGSLAGRNVAVWGLAFKPNTDDVREAPALEVIERLLAAGARVVAFDPEAIETTRAVLGDRIDYAPDAYAALEGADCLAICTEWGEFRRPDFARMKKLLAEPLVFDGRNLYSPPEMAERGFEYHSIGRPSVPVAGRQGRRPLHLAKDRRHP